MPTPTLLLIHCALERARVRIRRTEGTLRGNFDAGRVIIKTLLRVGMRAVNLNRIKF